MITYIIRKVIYASIVLWGVLTVVFFLFNVLPGEPARMMLDKREDEKQLLIIKKKYAFDRSITDQYLLYINDVFPISLHSNNEDAFTSLDTGKYKYFKLFFRSDFTVVLKLPYLRESFVKTNTPVMLIIMQTFKNTFVLAFSSMLIALILGIVFGLVCSLYKNSFFDNLILLFSALGMSLPSFFSAILIAWFFGFVLNSYTGLSMTGSLFEIDDYGRGTFLEINNLILPAITLAIRPLAVIVQLCRNSFLDVFSMDYVRTAKAKGLSRSMIVLKHVLRNAFNPVLTAVSGWFASLLAGAVFVEYVFAWNGIGKEIVDALNKMDLPVIMGSVLFIASIFVIINIMVDLIYASLDPRIRLE